MKVAVLQPTYLPWVGVLKLIDSVDTYVFYDDVQFEAQSWQQRNRIKTSQGTKWLTVPIERDFGQKINEVKVNYQTDWRDKHFKTIQQAYSQAPHFNENIDFFFDFYNIRFLLLGEMTIYLTRRLTEGFGLHKPQFLKSSEFQLEGAKTDRLICLLKQLKATEYISGIAARNYIEESRFKKEGIKLTWFDYKPKEYPQLYGAFVPYLSAIDLLFNMGDESSAYI